MLETPILLGQSAAKTFLTTFDTWFINCYNIIGDQMKETWKPVKGYENYFVSDLGRVKTKQGRYKKINYGICKYGYLDLWKDNKSKRFRVHRLVAEQFVPNPYNKEQVNHIDGNKKNNQANNLEWVTPKENIQHAINNNLSSIKFGSRNHSAKLTESDVLYIRDVAKKTKTVRELAEQFNVSTTNIYNIINNKKWLKM